MFAVTNRSVEGDHVRLSGRRQVLSDTDIGRRSPDELDKVTVVLRDLGPLEIIVDDLVVPGANRDLHG